jgi:hypothetical protein
VAKKEQCIECKGFNSNTGLCTIKWQEPLFDRHDCHDFKNKLSSGETETHTEKQDKEDLKEENSQSSYLRVKKRGLSHVSNSVFVKSEMDKENEISEKSGLVLEVPENVFRIGSRILGILLLIAVVLGVIYGIYAYVTYQERQEKEDLIWKAKVVLEEIRGDKTIGYLRLNKIIEEDNMMRLSFLRNICGTNGISHFSDTLMYKEMASLITIAPQKWDSLFSLLQEIGADLSIEYSDVKGKPAILIPHSQLQSKLLAKELLDEGDQIFIQRKSEEVVQYAKKHFAGDTFFDVDTVTHDTDYVTLWLKYDDGKAQLGKSFLDRTYINPHFTDPVGDMGSIFDNMWPICLRTNKGIAIDYQGTKSNSKNRVEWNAIEIKELHQKYGDSFYTEHRKTNQVHTVIVKEKQ